MRQQQAVHRDSVFMDQESVSLLHAVVDETVLNTLVHRNIANAAHEEALAEERERCHQEALDLWEVARTACGCRPGNMTCWATRRALGLRPTFTG